jgi:hypothetical protein
MIVKWTALQFLHHCKAGLEDFRPNPVLQPNARFRNRHRGRRCFILGSGPSILEQDLTPLEDEIVMTQNHFHAHDQIGAISPEYHVVVPKYQPRAFDPDWIAWFESMEAALPEKTAFFLGTNTRYLVERHGFFKGRAYYMSTGYRAAFLNRARTDITRQVMEIPTVLIQCLIIALYMGFREIVLLGMDLDQICRMEDRDRVRFYGNSQITRNDSEKGIERGSDLTGEGWLSRWIIWHQCRLLREAAGKKGVRIINATRGGLLNAFDRAGYEELIGRAD